MSRVPHPGDYTRISKAIAEKLMFQRFEYWMADAAIEPEKWHRSNLSFVRPLKDIEDAAARYNDHTHTFKVPINWTVDPAHELYPIVAAHAFFLRNIAFSREHGGQLGRAHYYFENMAVERDTLARGLDFIREREGWHPDPSGPLCVLHFDAFANGRLGAKAVALLVDNLPRWIVRAPKSYMMRASKQVSINRIGTGQGRSRIEQVAYRMSDIKPLLEWLGLPYIVYARDLPGKYINEEYRNGCQKRGEGAFDCRSHARVVESGAG